MTAYVVVYNIYLFQQVFVDHLRGCLGFMALNETGPLSPRDYIEGAR